VFVNPVEIEGASADKPQVSFQRVGQQLFLTRIQTAYDVCNIPVPRAVIMNSQTDHTATGPLQKAPAANRSLLV